MFTLVAFSEQHATGGTEQLVKGVPDPSHRVNGDDIYIGKEFNRIVGAYAFGHSIGDARLVSPSLRGLSSQYITPLVNDQGGYGQFTTRRFDDRHDCSVLLTPGEALNAYINCTTGLTQYNDTLAVWLAKENLKVIKGEIVTVKASDSDIAAVEKVWVNGEMAWEPDLPVGRYAIVGARCYMANGGLFRFNFIGGIARPGGICIHEQCMQEDPNFRLGNLGHWGEFDSQTPPSLEVMVQNSDGATGAWLRVDLIRL